jgi:hypothetical protein
VDHSISRGDAVALDLKYLGLIASVGAAAAFRFFSDFSFTTIQHQAALANLSLDRLTPGELLALTFNSLSYELQRDWFNPQHAVCGDGGHRLRVRLGASAVRRRLKV